MPRQYESIASLQFETYVSSNAKAEPERWQEGLGQLIAFDATQVGDGLRAAQRQGVGTSAGFTLIELSIVLVIIGLIVGGVLTGQTLIRAAQIRAEVTQIEQFNQAVNTFRGKYNCLPGDCANATTFFPSLTAGPYANGNGNGSLDDYLSNTPNTTGYPGSVYIEPSAFWVHLNAANLVACCNVAGMSLTSFVIGQSFPQDKVNGFGIGANTMMGKNGYYWGITTSCTYGNSCAGSGDAWNYSALSGINGVLTPAQAQAFDTKVDDGMATTGNVFSARVYGGDNLIHPGPYYAGYNCVSNTTPPAYNLGYGSLACSLWINAQW